MAVGYGDNAQPIVSSTPFPGPVTITQRPAVLPHNYHAQLAASGHYLDSSADDQIQDDYSTEAYDEQQQHLYKRNSNKKRQSVQNRDDQVKKFETVANRMKMRMKSVRSSKSADTKPQTVQE